MPYDALRKNRRSIANTAYFVTASTHGRTPVFRDFDAARLLIHEIRRLHDIGAVYSYAWVVMPDHLHWLLQLRESWPLATAVKTVKARSALAINRRKGRVGRLWQRGYYEHAIRAYEDIRSVARYMVANPLRAGLVRDVRDYSHWDCIWMDDREGGLLVE